MTTAKQLAADRANLAKARAVIATRDSANRALRHRHEHEQRTYAQVTKRLGETAAYKAEILAGDVGKHHPLGFRYAAYHAHATVPHRKPTGVYHRYFKARLASSSYMERTGWKASRSHRIHTRLKARRPKRLHVKDWRLTKHRMAPR